MCWPDSTENSEIRVAAVEALGNFDNARALGLLRTLAASVVHDTTRYANNRTEVSHQPTR